MRDRAMNRREMTRFSVNGDEDGDEERPNIHLTKRFRYSDPIVYTHRRGTGTASVLASASTPAARPAAAAAAAAGRPEGTVAAQEESEDQSSEDSDSSWDGRSPSCSSSDSDEEEQENQRSGNEVQPTEARENSAPSREAEGTGGAISVTLTDPDVLDCPICYEPLCSPIYQCENGHVVCASCCTMMKNICANCCKGIFNRCRAIEKVLDSIRITCRNMSYGCTETLSYSKKLAHEKACTYIPCSCPYTGCDFVGVAKCLYSHFSQKHTSNKFNFNYIIPISLVSTQKHAFLQEMSQRTLFILTRSVETVGSFINVVCVAPSLEKGLFSYEVTATAGESSIKLKTVVDLMTKWTIHPPAKMRLLVPSEFTSASGLLRLDVIIRRNASLAS